MKQSEVGMIRASGVSKMFELLNQPSSGVPNPFSPGAEERKKNALVHEPGCGWDWRGLVRVCLKFVGRVPRIDNGRIGTVLVVLASFISSALADCGPSEKLVLISTERVEKTVRFFVRNLQAADVTITFEVKSQNLRSTVEFPHTQTIPGGAKVQAFELISTNQSGGWSWEYTYYANFGNLEAQHDSRAVYLLPYSPGKSFRVSQGFNGEYSHHGPNQFAIDWRMPMGTPVHAAREGVVVGMKDDSEIGGPDAKFDACANFILIRHPDGTMGHYVHLKKGGARVKVGQEVRAGEFIGRSGNTGHTTGPHLHFSVFKARDGRQRQSIPIKFQTLRGIAAALEEDTAYVAVGSSEASSSDSGIGKSRRETDR